ncbi:MAG: hypothetical protein ACK5MY_10395 [Jhaorihella sp.]
MKHASLMMALGLAIAGCGPMTIYHRPGVSVSRMQADSTECEVQALRDAPVANQVRQRPPVYFPGTRVCDGAGNCWVGPGYWAGGELYTVDVNRDLRARATDMCMARRGYSPVSLPPCSAAVRAAAPARQTTTLPDLTPRTCVIRYDGGGWQVVNPVAAKG